MNPPSPNPTRPQADPAPQVGRGPSNAARNQETARHALEFASLIGPTQT
jgi:hypothetical protein